MTPIRALLRTTAATLALLTMIAGTLLVTSAGATAASAVAPASARGPSYGAIAIGADGAAGYSKNFGKKKTAYKRALKECNSRSSYKCVKVGWVRNGCAAVSVKYRSNGFVKRYKFGYAGSLSKAKKAARRGFGGSVLTSMCSR